MHTQNKSKQEIKVGVIVSAYRTLGSVRRALQVLPPFNPHKNLAGRCPCCYQLDFTDEETH